jgi:hypothetical protein
MGDRLMWSGRSARALLAAAIGLALGLSAAPVYAAPPPGSADTTPTRDRGAQRSYAAPLAWAYGTSLGIEAISWGVTAAVPARADGKPNLNTYASYAAAIDWPATFLAPPSVHIANSEGLRGLGALGGSLGSFAIGLAFGFAPALAAASATADDQHPWGSRVIFPLWMECGIAGQVIWAVHEVNQNSTRSVDHVDHAYVRGPRLELSGVAVEPLSGGARLDASFFF